MLVFIKRGAYKPRKNLIEVSFFCLGTRNDAKDSHAFLLARVEGEEVVAVASASSVDELLARISQRVEEEARHVRLAGSSVSWIGTYFRWRHGPKWNFDSADYFLSRLVGSHPASVRALVDALEVVAVGLASSEDELLAILARVVEVVTREVSGTGSGVLRFVTPRVNFRFFPGEDRVVTNNVLQSN